MRLTNLCRKETLLWRWTMEGQTGLCKQDLETDPEKLFTKISLKCLSLGLGQDRGTRI